MKQSISSMGHKIEKTNSGDSLYILTICIFSYGEVLTYLFMNANKWVIILSYKVEMCALTHTSECEA